MKRTRRRRRKKNEEVIYEVSLNGASFQRKPVQNCCPFLRPSSEGSGRPNSTAWMVNSVVHKATQDSINEKIHWNPGVYPI